MDWNDYFEKTIIYERYNEIASEFTFDHLMSLYYEIIPLEKSDLRQTILGAMWVFYPEDFYKNLSKIQTENEYDQLRIHQFYYLDTGFKAAITQDYRIEIKEDSVYENLKILSQKYLELVEIIRVFNSRQLFRLKLRGVEEIDIVARQIFREAEGVLRRLKNKKWDTKNLGELIWMEGLLNITWKYLGLSFRRLRKYDNQLKRRIRMYADDENNSMSDEMRKIIKIDYSEETFDYLNSVELRWLGMMDTTWDRIIKSFRKLTGRTTDPEKKLKLLLDHGELKWM